MLTTKIKLKANGNHHTILLKVYLCGKHVYNFRSSIIYEETNCNLETNKLLIRQIWYARIMTSVLTECAFMVLKHIFFVLLIN